MAANFTKKEKYQNIFSPKDYLHTFYDPKTGLLANDGFLKFALRKLHEAFTVWGVKGKTMIDIGHGPTIYQDLSACEVFEEIIGADYSDRNRKYYERSLKNEPGTFDWTDVIKSVCEMEGKGMTVEEKKEKLKNTVTNTIKCDVTKNNPMEPLVLPKVDCVTTVWCLECASDDLGAFKKYLRNIFKLLAPGGHLIMLGMLNSSFFMTGGERFSTMKLTEESMIESVTAKGLVTIDQEVVPREYNEEQYKISDHDSFMFLLARKVKNV